ncbi:MAG: type IV secretory system conjugative DNA transfer family protein [bacterium]|nr:type IV secretory system conjugative DNA transfer family protein [bacterium]
MKMTLKRVSFFVTLLISSTGYAQSEKPSLYDRLRSPSPSPEASAISAIVPLRGDMLRDAAMALGVRAGMAAKSRKYFSDIELRKIELDRQYRFSFVLTDSGVFVPPVIVEARDSLAGNAETLRITKAIYQIVRRGKLQPYPPSWRDYLFVGLNASDPDEPSEAVRPKGDNEMLLWRASFDKGYSSGESTADSIYEQNVARLDRDYLGMYRYTSLKDKGLMTAEVITASHAAAKENSPSDMSVDETTYRLSRQPEFKADASAWKKPASAKNTETGKQ